jgi:hypothetical protein
MLRIMSDKIKSVPGSKFTIFTVIQQDELFRLNGVIAEMNGAIDTIARARLRHGLCQEHTRGFLCSFAYGDVCGF